MQLRRWLDEAEQAGVEEANAFVLATVSAEGRPSARTLLLKAVTSDGYTFFTNYGSRKASELASNEWAAAVFLWVPLRRQVRIEGTVARVPPEVSDAYFASRPLEARLASAASPQSKVVSSREQLESWLQEVRLRHPGDDVPRPETWGGYILSPRYYEFWQGREARFHDRFRYTPAGGSWLIERLAP
ncbi:MAG TPA: pyridoxamine 5'-phosphate oxidase, partial [Acidimicrobiia bacterium]|nr:pyridoxamine 5'-phosphate oxidase [Acidimicrobiia bacterium]